eukprot:TRINITY_DN63377_c0_g1_i2.p1 TRINITY_DN63377_c0_g1~~TRINITY_DN63377_c0_g1_i2.p1  ORF type:complete len:541 (-),score=107.18 TRINITY_DN63377_c0_g1_i2:551-2023(-)
MAAIKEKITAIQHKKMELKMKAAAATKEKREQREKERAAQQPGESKRQILIRQKRDVDHEISVLTRKITQKRKEISSAEAEKRQLKSSAAGAHGYGSQAELNQAIRNLEYELETGASCSIKREKQINNQIRALQACRPAVEAAGFAVEAMRQKEEDRKALMNVMQEFSADLTRLRAEQTRLAADIDKENEKIKQAPPSTDTDRNAGGGRNPQDRDDLTLQLDKLYNQMRDETAQYRANVAKWNDWRKAEMERKKKIREEQAQARAILQQMNEDANDEYVKRSVDKDDTKEIHFRMNPKEGEINLCDSLLVWLKQLQTGNQSSSSSPTTEKKSGSERPTTTLDNKAVEQAFSNVQGGKGKVLVGKKSRNDEDDWLYGSSKKKKQAKKQQSPTTNQQQPAAATTQKKKQSRGLQLNMGKLQWLSILGVDPPTSHEDISKTIQTVKDLKAEFESEKRSYEDVKAEMDQTRSEREEKKRKEEPKDDGWDSDVSW